MHDYFRTATLVFTFFHYINIARAYARALKSKKRPRLWFSRSFCYNVNKSLQTFVYIDFLSISRLLSRGELYFISPIEPLYIPKLREYKTMPSRAEISIKTMGDGFFPSSFLSSAAAAATTAKITIPM